MMITETAAPGASMRRFGAGGMRTRLNYELERIVKGKTIIEKFDAYDLGAAFSEVRAILEIHALTLQSFYGAGGVAVWHVSADGSQRRKVFPWVN